MTIMNSRINKLRRGIVEEEQVGADIFLGEEFQNCSCLTVSEVYHFLSEKKAQQASHSKSESMDVSAAVQAQEFLKVLRYAESFSQFSTPTGAIEIRKIIESHDRLRLHEFEIAQIGNFLCDTSDMMKSYVPSLARIDDNDLQELLDRISQVRKFA
ncbi:RNA polymerase B [Coelomomyces lativittatus]|nr:RNA polymerase B [Coelomomyces lativittatus]KAJ1500449.1 RNA polymerase B [Coelomomyces lativittatus]KAJ1514342.1 RNA polymerase B [Coelomomyces lativittatus]